MSSRLLSGRRKGSTHRLFNESRHTVMLENSCHNVKHFTPSGKTSLHGARIQNRSRARGSQAPEAVENPTIPTKQTPNKSPGSGRVVSRSSLK
jgi:hypothetical protein